MTKEELIKAKAGNFAQVLMIEDGSINLEFGKLKEFKILGIVAPYESTSYALLLYPSELTYSSSVEANLDKYSSDDWVDEIYNIWSYKNQWSRWVDNLRISKIKSADPDGCFCKICHEFYDMAVTNQPDNTLICYSCRQNPLRAYY